MTISVYKVTRDFPKNEMWGLISQIRRAAVSVPANIVEGSARRSKNEYLQFLYISMSSLSELSYYIRLSKQLGYLNSKNYNELWEKVENSLKTLNGLISYIENSQV